MNASRLAAWIFGVAVCSAWLASAAGVGRATRPPRTAADAPANAELLKLAADVQAQAGRLRERLASAPAPAPAVRNPFAFAERRRLEASARPMAAPVNPAPIFPEPASEPSIRLIGIADMSGAQGGGRVAMIEVDGQELVMARTGQRVLGRFDVTAISADAVELKEIETGAVRRLVLQ